MTRYEALAFTGGIGGFCAWSTVCVWVGYHSAKNPQNALLTAPAAFACLTAILTLGCLVACLWRAAQRPAHVGETESP